MEWESICRVCLQGGDMVSLFDCDENNELLRDKYSFCSSIEVSETEPLPSNICLTCVDRLLSAYQFKQQCVSSNETLQECLSEFQKSGIDPPVTVKNGTEVITIKQENGVFLQYEIPVDEEAESPWPLGRGLEVSPAPKRRRGRPRKYPNDQGYISPSPYHRKDSQASILKPKEEPLESANEAVEGQEEGVRAGSPLDDGELADYTTDPDYMPGGAKDDDNDESDGTMELTINPKDGTLMRILKTKSSKNKRGRPRKSMSLEVKQEQDSDNCEEDVLLQETLMANSEPILDSILNPQPKKKYPKKKYYYDKVHTCEQCGSSFRSNASLQAHIRRHLGIKPFVCSVCGYACVLNMELRRHMMRHTGQKPYKCRICERHFGDFGSRQKHERLHLGERPYQCTLCGKNFTYSYVLSNHMLTHTGEKKYSCPPCNKRFTKAHHLKYHNKVHHKELYMQQQLVQQAKKMQHINIAELTTVCTEQLLGLSQGGQLDENLQVHHEDLEEEQQGEGEHEQEEHMQEEEETMQEEGMQEEGMQEEGMQEGIQDQEHMQDQEYEQEYQEQQEQGEDEQEQEQENEEVSDRNEINIEYEGGEEETSEQVKEESLIDA